ncbi:MAG: hypothetical protein AB1715_10345 [Acidobacteriota bacterium]
MKIVRWAPKVVGAEEAVRIFCARSLKVPFSIELVYLPFVFFKYTISLTTFCGEKKSSRGLFLVDMIQGVPTNVRKDALLDLDPGLEDDFAPVLLPPKISVPGAPASNREVRILRLESHAAEESQVLSPLLPVEEAIARGKRLLRYDLMRLAGGLRYRKFEITVHPETRVIHHPFWLIYYRSRRGEMRLSVVDGVSGKKENDEITRAIKLGLVKKEASSALKKNEGANPN